VGSGGEATTGARAGAGAVVVDAGSVDSFFANGLAQAHNLFVLGRGLGIESFRLPPEQYRQRKERLALLKFERRNRGALRKDRRLLARNVERRDRPVARARIDHPEHALGDQEVSARDHESPAQGQHLEVGARDTGHEREPHRLLVEAGGAKRGFGRAHSGGVPSPQVNLVACAQGGARGIVAAPGAAVRPRFAAPGAGAEVQRRKQRRARDPHEQVVHALRRTGEIFSLQRLKRPLH